LGSIGYLILSGDMIASTIYPDVLNPTTQKLEKSENYSVSRVLTQIIILVVLSPLFFCKQINKTNLANIFGIICWIYVAIVAIVFSSPLVLSEVLSEKSVTSFWPNSPTGVFSRLPVFIFAYGCQQNLFSVISETKNAKNRSQVSYFSKISVLATLTGFIVFLPVMIFPYVSFGNKVSSNFLSNISSVVLGQTGEVFVKIAKICAAVSVCLSLPLQIHPMRHSFLTLYASFGPNCEKNLTKNSEKSELFLRIIFTGFPLVLILVIAMIFKSLGLFLSISGVIGSNTISFFIPSLLYVLNCQKLKNVKTFKFYSAFLMLIFSSLLYPVCLGCLLYEHSK